MWSYETSQAYGQLSIVITSHLLICYYWLWGECCIEYVATISDKHLWKQSLSFSWSFQKLLCRNFQLISYFLLDSLVWPTMHIAPRESQQNNPSIYHLSTQNYREIYYLQALLRILAFEIARKKNSSYFQLFISCINLLYSSSILILHPFVAITLLLLL